MSKKAPSILIVEDNRELLTRLRNTLVRDGYEIFIAESGQEARRLFAKHIVDMLVLDIVLPDCNGLELCKWVREREQSHLPIIILTVKTDESHMLQAFTLFADDYVTKPFSMPVFLARVKAHLRNQPPAGPIFTVGPLTVDFLQHRVHVNGHEVPLPQNEYKTLKILIENKDRLVTTDTLIYRLWPGDDQLDAAREKEVYTYISNLRRKIDRPAQRRFIKTIPLTGYRFQTEEES